MTAFIALVRDRMEAEGLTNREVAQRCGMHEGRLHGLLSGKLGSATTKTMDQIANGLGLRVGIYFEERG